MEALFYPERPLLASDGVGAREHEKSSWTSRRQWIAKTIVAFVSNPSGQQVATHFTHKVAVGLATEHGFREDLHWIVFEGEGQRIHLSESMQEDFLRVVQMDIRERSPTMYSMKEIGQMAEQTKGKGGEPVEKFTPASAQSVDFARIRFTWPQLFAVAIALFLGFQWLESKMDAKVSDVVKTVEENQKVVIDRFDNQSADSASLRSEIAKQGEVLARLDERTSGKK